MGHVCWYMKCTKTHIIYPCVPYEWLLTKTTHTSSFQQSISHLSVAIFLCSSAIEFSEVCFCFGCLRVVSCAQCCLYVFERLFILCTIVATRIIHIDLSDPTSTFSNIAFFTLYLFNICRVYMSNNSRIKQDNQR